MGYWAKIYSALHDIWGDVCGYKRRRIRKEVISHINWEAGQLADYSLDMFRKRYCYVVENFSCYARKAGQIKPENLMPDDLPVWTKDDMKEWFSSLSNPPIAGAWIHKTGGTGGIPLNFYVTRESYEWRTAVSDRGYSWAGAQPGINSVYIWGGALGKESLSHKIKETVTQSLQRRWFFDAFIMDEQSFAACCALINKVKPQVIVGYSGCLVALADYVLKTKDALKHRAQSVITAAEALMEEQDELIRETLGNNVFRSYGSREFMLIGMECKAHKGYHLSTDNLYVEVVDNYGRPVKEGEIGRILITDLHNDASPFIRYEIGDLGVFTNEKCPCGLPFPLLSKVEGRIQQDVKLPNGKTASMLLLPHLMKEFKWIRAYQMIKRGNSFELNVIAENQIQAEESARIVRILKRKMGDDIEFVIKNVEQLRKLPNGKTPVFIDETN